MTHGWPTHTLTDRLSPLPTYITDIYKHCGHCVWRSDTHQSIQQYTKWYTLYVEVQARVLIYKYTTYTPPEWDYLLPHAPQTCGCTMDSICRHDCHFPGPEHGLSEYMGNMTYLTVGKTYTWMTYPHPHRPTLTASHMHYRHIQAQWTLCVEVRHTSEHTTIHKVIYTLCWSSS